ncbi:acyl-CoA hydrolase [Haloferula luteola]|uniref:Acyl-CoA hydrolase n=1 Tax=Haloferula luteola TaxID=595692 RepID=A0A840V1M8_9BACT|nr:hotdog domain-containing protein [Haloferula luteola]MBB5351303.1 acyl-CoA hydrolase [Haloferula luteola]
METQRLVLPEDLNHLGFLFGGRLLAWVDEACWIAASLDFPHCQFVTIGMDKVEFRHSVRQGTILSIRCEKYHEGRTSAGYSVEVLDRRNPGSPPLFTTHVTYVSVDDEGRKRPIR